MSKRRVKLVLLCEDSQHEAFARRFLQGMGWNTRELRVEKSPSSSGSAEQWVRQRFPLELKVYRRRRQQAASALMTIIDADLKTGQDRMAEFEYECTTREIPFRKNDEAVAIVIPKRNIETWIHYLNGYEVNDRDSYSRLDRERDCRPAVSQLVGLCRSTGLAPDAPPSLTAACEEYDRVRAML